MLAETGAILQPGRGATSGDGSLWGQHEHQRAHASLAQGFGRCVSVAFVVDLRGSVVRVPHHGAVYFV